jgi:hypothetical protein
MQNSTSLKITSADGPLDIYDESWNEMDLDIKLEYEQAKPLCELLKTS